jgi:hypothetical protein
MQAQNAVEIIARRGAEKGRREAGGYRPIASSQMNSHAFAALRDWLLTVFRFCDIITFARMVGVAQLVRVPGCGPGGRGFEPHRSPQYIMN